MILERNIDFRLLTGDFNNYEQIVPYAVLNLLQESASIHGEETGVGFFNMLEKGLIWVLAKIKYEVIKQPNRFSQVRVNTWPLRAPRFEAGREFIVFDENNEIVLKASSKWCLFDVKKGRIALASNAEFNGEFADKKEHTPLEFEIIPYEKKKEEYLFTHVVSYSDLDRNQHMNNAKYGILIYDALALLENELIKDFQIDFVSQAFLHENIHVYQKKNNKERVIYGIKDDESVVFKALVNIA